MRQQRDRAVPVVDAAAQAQAALDTEPLLNAASAVRPRRWMAEAVAALARRDMSRQELRERMLRKAQTHQAQLLEAHSPEASGHQVAYPAGAAAAAEPADPMAAATAIDAALDRLAALGFLDDARFARSRAEARAPRHGLRRIAQELERLGTTLDADAADTLRSTEAERARALWERRFGEPATEARSHARQARFLLARGFDADLVRRIVGPVPYRTPGPPAEEPHGDD
jgi:regulatory protein